MNTLEQIDKFNNTPSNPDVENSKSIVDTYLYMNSNIAKDLSSFFKFILSEHNIDKKLLKNIIDLAYGSGNFSAHIIIDTDIEAKKIILNDKEKELINKNINIKNISTITNYDFLENLPFSDIFNLVIFNPQIGGSYSKGESHLEKEVEVIVSDLCIDDYLKNLNLDFKYTVQIDESEKSILIHSDDATKSNMEKQLKQFKVFNYYDIFYQSKESNKAGNPTNIIKLRKNLSSNINDKSIIVYYGDEKPFKTIFKDYGTAYRYKTNHSGDLFIALKDGNKYICYEKEENTFYDVDCENKQITKEIDGNLENLFTTLDTLQNKAKEVFKKSPLALSALEGNQENIEEETKETTKKEEKEHIRFANFLIGEKQQYKKDKKRFKNFLIDNKED
jgi:hypothetical protein